MKTFTLSICVLMFSTFAFTQSLEGIWNTGKENTKVEITEENGYYQGTIHSSNNPEATIGKVILKAGKVKNQEEFVGKIYAVKKGKWFDADFFPKGKKLTIKISAGWSTKTQEWTFAE